MKGVAFTTRLLGAVAVALLITGALLLLPIFGKPLLSVGELLRNRERRFSSREVLERITDLYELQTVEYVYRMVFPHDCYLPDLSMGAIFDRLGDGEGSAEELLSREELAHLDAHNLAHETGLATSPEGEDFVVVSARVRAGYVLDGTQRLGELFRVEPLTGDEGSSPTEKEALLPERSRVTCLLPSAEVVSVVIEDLNLDNYPYPSPRVDAEEWRDISLFIRKEARERTVQEGILEDAEGNARDFLEGLLKEAGFAEISFEAADPEE